MTKLYNFNGGVKPETHKSLSRTLPIALAPLPHKLAVSLQQSVGRASLPTVEIGARVLKGERIAVADQWISSAIHAPTSGRVIDIVPELATHPSGLPTLSIMIEPDGEDQWIERRPIDYAGLAPEHVREILRDAGLVGLGGAAFPSHAKLSASRTRPMEELVINGAECEPFMTCDDRLMQERADDIVKGIEIFETLLQPKKVLIGIEDNKPEALLEMRAAIKRLNKSYSVFAVPTRYPAGGAKQLIRVLTGKEVPASQRSPEMGVQCFNVATAYAAARVLLHGEPLISRIVTLTGNVASPRNWEFLLGTPLAEAIDLASPKPDTNGYIMGGPMMGFEMPGLAAPITKATNCIIASSAALFPPPPPEMPCIRCTACASACPHELQPFELYWFSRARQFDKAKAYNLFECIECGCCSYVCPSQIPLVQYFRFAKSEINAQMREKEEAQAAKARFEFKNTREARDKAEKAERLAKAAQAQNTSAQSTDSAEAPSTTAAEAEAAKKAKIAAALERAKQMRESAPTEKTSAQAGAIPATPHITDTPDATTLEPKAAPVEKAPSL